MNSRNLFSESVQPSIQYVEFDPVLCTNFARSKCLQRQRQLQSSYIVPDQTRHIELVVGQILEIEFENSCPFCVLSNLRNPELSGNTKSTNSFEPNSVMSNFGMSQVAPIEVFPSGKLNSAELPDFEFRRFSDVYEGIEDF